ncbi:hypothetical protein LTR56_002168 [Elasticomyces elasticus]|nr:hypothetical protein LTR56_002168 [Elasticomyces elasticus]KAK3666047.1 hypothetical protein LTR22_003050 [Elasticomyces elasticus]KAK4929534.1 hypothetical protein LTR49_003829 [Elasticomyces elasticus]KAK5767508.1 hypothetical protein LTS12_002349 [Elasticomyces elasticus]
MAAYQRLEDSEGGPNNFLYPPLDIQRKQIRTLKVLPGWPGSAIRCRLSIVSLTTDPRPKYDALSYTWGAATKARFITVEVAGTVHKVGTTNNLYEAVQSMRARIAKVWTVWVDALCIDQSNNAERATQVAMMGEIYRNARQVDIWLGMPNPASSLVRTRQALGNIRHLCTSKDAVVSIYDDMIRREDSAYRAKTKLLRVFYHIIVRQIPQRIDESLCNSLPRWMDRAWVMQEYAVARRTVFHFGRRRLVWDDRLPSTGHFFYLVIQGLENYDHLFSTLKWMDSQFTNENGPMLGDKTMPRSRLHKKLGSLRMSAMSTRLTQCTDPRDKVYSLLGLIPPEEARLIAPNYTLPVWVVYARATFACIMADGLARVLKDVEHSSGAFDTLPSWTIDFSRYPLSGMYAGVSYSGHGLDTVNIERRQAQDTGDLASHRTELCLIVYPRDRLLRHVKVRDDTISIPCAVLSTDQRCLVVHGTCLSTIESYTWCNPHEIYKTSWDPSSTIVQDEIFYLADQMSCMMLERDVRLRAVAAATSCPANSRTQPAIAQPRALTGDESKAFTLIPGRRSEGDRWRMVDLLIACGRAWDICTQLCNPITGCIAEDVSLGMRNPVNEIYWYWNYRESLSVCVTSTGLLVFSPEDVLCGDVLVLLAQCTLPIICRSWHRICILIYDLRNLKNDKACSNRLDQTTDELYISAPYFSADEAAIIKAATVNAPTTENETADETATTGSASTERITLEQAISSSLQNFFDKRKASGDCRPCGPHDMVPVYLTCFGIEKAEIEDEKFLSRVRRSGLGGK